MAALHERLILLVMELELSLPLMINTILIGGVLLLCLARTLDIPPLSRRIISGVGGFILVTAIFYSAMVLDGGSWLGSVKKIVSFREEAVEKTFGDCDWSKSWNSIREHEEIISSSPTMEEALVSVQKKTKELALKRDDCLSKKDAALNEIRDFIRYLKDNGESYSEKAGEDFFHRTADVN